MAWLDRLRALFQRRAQLVHELPAPPYPRLRPPIVRLPDDETMVETAPEAVATAPIVAATRSDVITQSSSSLADLTCMISYVDAAGQESVRRISIKQIIRSYRSVLLVAYCHERAALRHFRLDRIDNCWDCTTGEVINIEELVALEPSAFQAEQPSSPPPPMQLPTAETGSAEIELTMNIPQGFRMPEPPDQRPELQPRTAARRAMVQRCGDGLRVLRFLALCDGKVHPLEEAAEATYARDMCEGEQVGLPTIEYDYDFLMMFTRRLRPTPETMLAAFGVIIGRGRAAEVKRLLDGALMLIQIDGQLRHEEIHFAGELTRILKTLPREAP